MTNDFQHLLKDIKSNLQKGLFLQALELTQKVMVNVADLTLDEQLEVLYFQAVCHRYLNNLTKAYECHRKLQDLEPSYGRAYQESGYCLLAESRTEEALVAFHKAVEFNPALVATWQKIVELLRAQNHPNHTAAATQLSILQKLPLPVLGAMDLMYEGKLHKAEQVCRRFLANNKHQADAMCLLAEIGIKLKVLDDAEFLLESCVNLYPDNQQASAAYVNILNRLGKFELCAQQAEHFLTAFDAEPAVVITVKATLANCYVSLGELSQGIKIYQALVEHAPERAGLHVQLGHAYKTSGDLTKAVSCYQSAYKLQPNYGDAFWSLANTKTYAFSDSELSEMISALSKIETSIDDKIHINFALGKGYEDRKEFEQSFHFYQQGNALKHSVLSYDVNKTSELIDQQIQHCTKNLFEEKQGLGIDNAAPIFILGLPRAGSTLLEQILASHSQVDGTMELHNILGMALKLRGRIASGEPLYPKNLFELTAEQLTQMGEMFIRDTQSYRGNAPFFIDKMPNNFLHIGLIKLMLPNAKIIDARREPMACCFSGFKQLFGEGQEFSYHLSDIAQYYRDYERLMTHWDEVLPEQVLRVQHEDLVNNFEPEVRRILDYCQLPFEQECLEFYNTKRNVHTPSAEQVRQPISNKGLTQWQNYEAFLGELKQALGQ